MCLKQILIRQRDLPRESKLSLHEKKDPCKRKETKSHFIKHTPIIECSPKNWKHLSMLLLKTVFSRTTRRLRLQDERKQKVLISQNWKYISTAFSIDGRKNKLDVKKKGWKLLTRRRKRLLDGYAQIVENRYRL